MHMYTYMSVYAGAAVRISYMCENKICIHILHTLSRVCMCTYIYIYMLSRVWCSRPRGLSPLSPTPHHIHRGLHRHIHIQTHTPPCVCMYIYIYTTCMYKYTYIYIQINNHILYYSIQKYMHIHTHLYNLVKIPYTYRDRHHLERGGGECYGRLALIWRILYIQDLPGAAFA